MRKYNSMHPIILKYDGKPIEDDGVVNSAEMKGFAKDLKKALRGIAGVNLDRFTVGHYSVSGFLSKKGCEKLIYFSYDVPRGGLPISAKTRSAFGGILIRKAKDAKDFRGETNHFTSFFDFEEDVNDLFSGRTW